MASDAGEPEPEPLESIDPRLRPFVRTWQSKLLGYIELQGRRAPSGEFRDELDVFVPQAASSTFACVCKDMSEGELNLRLDFRREFKRGPGGQVDLPPDPIFLDKVASKRHRIVWNSHGRRADVWDLKLLDAVESSASHVTGMENLAYDLGCALSFLDCAADIPPRPATPWNPGGMTVGLCITTMRRFWQVQHALPLNLLHCWPHRSYTTIHLVIFDRHDGALDYVLRTCEAAIDIGLLRVYVTDELESWHASVAKNTSHMVADQDILVNCDGDNLVGPDFPFDVVRRIVGGKACLHYEDGDGTCGRIALERKCFHYLRGYDEDAYPMGAQDTDLIFRMKQWLGDQCYQKVRQRCWSQAIKNTMVQKVENCGADYGGLRWGQMDTYNRWLFQERRAAGQLQRNLGQEKIGVPCVLVTPV